MKDEGLWSETNVEVPFTCILSNSQQGATAVVAQRSKIVKKSMRNLCFCSLHL